MPGPSYTPPLGAGMPGPSHTPHSSEGRQAETPENLKYVSKYLVQYVPCPPQKKAEAKREDCIDYATNVATDGQDLLCPYCCV